MTVKRITAGHRPDNVVESLSEMAITINKIFDIHDQIKIIQVKEIASKALAELGTPMEFVKNFTQGQKDYIFDVQFKLVSAQELKPYLLADKVYMVHHFQDGLIPEDYYYQFDEHEPSLHITSEHLSDAQLSQVLSSLEESVKSAPLKSLDLREFHRITTLEVLSPLNLESVKKIDCTDMFYLKSLKGLPEKVDLDSLICNNCTPIESLSPLAGKSIRNLNIEHCSQIKDYRPLLAIRNLEKINLKGCMGIVNNIENYEIIKQLRDRGVQVDATNAVNYGFNRYLKNLPGET